MTVDRTHLRISLFSMEKDARSEDKENSQFWPLRTLRMSPFEDLNDCNNKERMREVSNQKQGIMCRRHRPWWCQLADLCE